MTLKQLQEIEQMGSKIFQILEDFSLDFEKKIEMPIKTKKIQKRFASGWPCFIISKKGLFGKKLFYFRNVIISPRQPSPIFIKIYDKKYEKDLLDLLLQKKDQIQQVLGVKVVFHTEENI